MLHSIASLQTPAQQKPSQLRTGVAGATQLQKQNCADHLQTTGTCAVCCEEDIKLRLPSRRGRASRLLLSNHPIPELRHTARPSILIPAGEGVGGEIYCVNQMVHLQCTCSTAQQRGAGMSGMPAWQMELEPLPGMHACMQKKPKEAPSLKKYMT